MRSLIQDVSFSLRLMRKRPGTTFLVIAALVLGIGLNAAIFSVVNAVLLRPLPIFQPDRLVRMLSNINQTGDALGVSYPDYLDWKAQNHSFEDITPMYFFSRTLTGNGAAEHLNVTGISASGFKVWGVSTILGRGFTEDDDRPGANRVVVLNYAFWQKKYGGDPNVLGKVLTLDDQPYTIIGVLQPTQLGTLQAADVYMTNGPLLNAHIMERDTRYFFPYGRLKPNLTLAQAQADMDVVASRLANEYSATNKDMGVVLYSLTEQLTASGRKPLLLLIAASSLIFLLAAVNVMTVLMSNTVERGQELTVRLALGASRLTLLRQLLIQALLFALTGGVLGLSLAKIGLVFFVQHFPTTLSRLQETNIDSTVVLVTLGTALLASLTATLLPALYAISLQPSSRPEGTWSSLAQPRYRALGRGALIIFEVWLASGLSLVSGLLIKSFYEVEKVNLGFNPSHVFSFQIMPPLTHYGEPAKQSALYKAAVEKLASLPGMASTSAISSLPLTNQGWVNTLEPDSQSPLFGQKLFVEDESILPGFFRAMEVPLLQGRDFNDTDYEGSAPVIIVDDVLAEKLWPGQNALGKHVRMSRQRGDPVNTLEVIGVVRQLKHFGPERAVRWMQVYVPQYQDPSPAVSFIVNTTMPENVVKTAVEKAVHDLDKDIPIEDFQSMDAYLDSFLTRRKVSLILLSAFAGIGIVLGVVGIYGVVASAVMQRRREIAIRMAVGASRSSTMVLITRLGLLATLAGVVIGSVTVLVMYRVLAAYLFGVSPMDPAIYILSAAVLLLLAVLASAVPAMRLIRFNIQDILRQ